MCVLRYTSLEIGSCIVVISLIGNSLEVTIKHPGIVSISSLFLLQACG